MATGRSRAGRAPRGYAARVPDERNDDATPQVHAEPVDDAAARELRFAEPGQAPLARRRAGEGLGVYSVASGLVAALPVPFVDQWLTPAVRGSALRRVAQRHNVPFTPAGREVLSAVGGGDVRRRIEGRVAREVFRQLLRPLRLVTRFEDGLYTLASAQLLDHYLRTADRAPGAPLDALEAERIRGAMETAMVEGLWSGVRAGPDGVLQTVRKAFDAVTTPDEIEQRGPVERLLDAVLEGAADGPAGLGGKLEDAFDPALQRADAARSRK